MRARYMIAIVASLTLGQAMPSQVARSRQPAVSPDSLRSLISALRRDPLGISLATDDVSRGPRIIAVGERVPGDVVADGDITVSGTVDGNVVALGANVIVPAGGRVGGSAVSVGGRVVADGVIGGDIRTLDGPLGVTPAMAARKEPVRATLHALSLSLGWFGVLGVIGFAVLLFARRNLEGVADTLEQGFGRAFLIGVVGELAVLPVLLLTTVVLAVTLIGIVVIPFAIIALLLALCGVAALGFLAVAYLTGEAVRRRGAGSPVAHLLTGLALYLGLWVLVALFTWAPTVALILGAMAMLVTWIAATTGFGAALISRGGTRDAPLAAPAQRVTDELTWQTPTPVSGVAAARRPTPVGRPGEP